VLETWNFPPDLCGAIGQHHRQVAPSANPLTRAVRAAMIVVATIPGVRPHACSEASIVDLTRGKMSLDALPAIAAKAQAAGSDLALALSS
jgi:HD-like signal output (HDOD) protein